MNNSKNTHFPLDKLSGPGGRKREITSGEFNQDGHSPANPPLKFFSQKDGNFFHPLKGGPHAD
jgi:hypothetical protein